jgi:hypothetical protein
LRRHLRRKDRRRRADRDQHGTRSRGYPRLPTLSCEGLPSRPRVLQTPLVHRRQVAGAPQLLSRAIAHFESRRRLGIGLLTSVAIAVYLSHLAALFLSATAPELPLAISPNAGVTPVRERPSGPRNHGPSGPCPLRSSGWIGTPPSRTRPRSTTISWLSTFRATVNPVTGIPAPAFGRCNRCGVTGVYLSAENRHWWVHLPESDCEGKDFLVLYTAIELGGDAEARATA